MVAVFLSTSELAKYPNLDVARSADDRYKSPAVSKAWDVLATGCRPSYFIIDGPNASDSDAIYLLVAGAGTTGAYRFKPWSYQPDGVIQEIMSEFTEGGFQTARTRYLGYVSAIPTIMAVPVSWEHASYRLTMPRDAATARILFGGGLGFLDGDLQFLAGSDLADVYMAAILGLLLTGVIDMVIPTIMLISGAGSGGGIVEKLVEKVLTGAGAASTFRSLLVIGGLILALIEGMSIASGAGTQFLTTITNGLIGFVTGSPKILAVMAGAEAGEWAEDSIPLAGQIIMAANLLATAAALAETTTELLIAPFVGQCKVCETFPMHLTIQHDPIDTSGFPATARYLEVIITYDNGTTRDHSPVPFQADGRVVTTMDPLTIVLPAAGILTVTVHFYADDRGEANTANPVAVGRSDALNAGTGEAREVVIVVKESVPPLDASTRYRPSRKLSFDGSDRTWAGESNPPVAVLPASGATVEGLAGLQSLAYGQLTARLDYSYQYRGGDRAVPVCGSPGQTETGPLSTLREASATGDHSTPSRAIACGTRDPILAVRELLPPRLAEADRPSAQTSDPAWKRLGFARAPLDFFVQPGTPRPDNSIPYFVRSLDEGGGSGFDLAQGLAWGQFPSEVVDLAVHPSGRLVALGVGPDFDRLYILTVPKGPVPDARAPLPKLASGTGDRINLLKNPRFVGCTAKGAILVLDDDLGVVQAFDPDGNPLTSHFATADVATGNQMKLKDRGANVHYADMDVEARGFLYVLLYEGDQPGPGDYRIDIYRPDGTFLASATGAGGDRSVDFSGAVFSVGPGSISSPGENQNSAITFTFGVTTPDGDRFRDGCTMPDGSNGPLAEGDAMYVTILGPILLTDATLGAGLGTDQTGPTAVGDVLRQAFQSEGNINLTPGATVSLLSLGTPGPGQINVWRIADDQAHASFTILGRGGTYQVYQTVEGCPYPPEPACPPGSTLQACQPSSLF